MNAVVFNLGCKVNQYECDVLREKLSFMGYDVSDSLTQADIYILNTCAVTGEAERKSRQTIARCKKLNQYARIFVLGCASQHNPESFRKDGVVYISGVADKLAVVDHLDAEDTFIRLAALPTKYEDQDLHSASYRQRAYIKIQDGCNHFCSYCLIPYVRGRSRSRDLNAIVREATILSDRTKEIVLTGVDVMSYGIDLGYTFIDLIRALNKIDARIRLSSVYAEHITTEMLDALFSLKHFCPHFHLSMQSGDNSVLKDMNRRYTVQDYLDKIDLIRRYDPMAGIMTDIIVGYPTETANAFDNTCQTIKAAHFSDIHVFPFSPRSGTRAYTLNALPAEIVSKRKKILLQYKKELHDDFLNRNIGETHIMLTEEEKDGWNVGYSENYIRIYTKKQGELVTCVPTELYKDGLKEV